MANQEHLNKLKEGIVAWNQWRHEHPEIQIDLRGADLVLADLRGADLVLADLRGADLRETLLIGANLSRADRRTARFAASDFFTAGDKFGVQ